MKTLSETDYVDRAEDVIKRLRGKKDRRNKMIPMVTTSKIRNLLAMTADIYNIIINHPGEEIPQSCRERIDYLRIRFVYESGREPRVKDFVEEAGILPILKEIGGDKKNYILYNRYMEALVAFHRFYEGRDQ